MGQAGTLPSSFGRVHPVYQTPTFAIAMVQIVGILLCCWLGWCCGRNIFLDRWRPLRPGGDHHLLCGEPGADGVHRREHPAHFNIWHHVVSPWIGTLALLPVLFVTMYPEPEWPYNIAPYFLVVSLIAGFGYMQWLESRHPGALLRGATMLVGSRSTSEGDVDWDKPIAPLSSTKAERLL